MANKADKTEAKDQLNADCSTAYRTHSISIINETAAGIEIAFWVLIQDHDLPPASWLLTDHRSGATVLPK